MPSVFGGLSRAITVTLGDPVTLWPDGPSARSVLGLIRTDQIEVEGEEGMPVLAPVTTLRLRLSDAVGLHRDDMIEDASGRRWAIDWNDPPVAPSPDPLTLFYLKDSE